MRSHWLRVVVGFVIVAAASSVFADNINDPPEAQAQYATGKRLMHEGDFIGAARIFEELSQKYPVSEHLDLYIFQRAKAKYYQGDYDFAITSFKYLIDRFPNSKTLGHVYFFMGNSQYMEGRVSTAVQNFLLAYKYSSDKRLDQLITASLTEIIENASSVKLSQADFTEIPSEKRCPMAQTIARLIMDRGDSVQAIQIIKVCSPEADINQINQDKQPRKGDIKVALVLPFSGELQQYGEQIYNGAVIAARDFNATTGRHIELVPYNSKGDAVEVARIVSELARNNTFLAAVGPLTSDAAAVASASLVCGDLPMIVPAATQSGLTKLSQTSFQLSPNIELEGIVAADYAGSVLGADTAAVITSTDSDYLRMSEAFIRRFKELGGTIIGTEYYRPRDRDFGPQVLDIKKELLGIFPDSIYYINPNGDTVELDAVPAHVDCIYMPGDAEQIKLLVPQVNFYNLSGVFLGSDGWGDERIYNLGDNVTKSSIFPSPFLEKESSEINLKFSASYDIRYGKRPERLSALGYDAIRLIVDAFMDGGSSRDRITKKLAALDKFQGASGRITFGRNRENIEMPLYKIENGRPILITSKNPTAELLNDSQ